MSVLRWAWICGSLVVSLLGARPAGAAACAPGTLQSYIDLGAPGCSAGGVVVANFALAPGQTFATPIDPTLIQVTPAGTAEAPALVLTFSSSASAGELLESFFHFDAQAPALFSAGIALAGASATGDGVVTATQDLCPGGAFVPGSPTGCPTAAEALITFVSESDALLSADASVAGATFLDVFTDIAIDGGLSGSAGLGSVTLSFSAIPEPSTAGLLVAGLALLARLRPRRGD